VLCESFVAVVVYVLRAAGHSVIAIRVLSVPGTRMEAILLLSFSFGHCFVIRTQLRRVRSDPYGLCTDDTEYSLMTLEPHLGRLPFFDKTHPRDWNPRPIFFWPCQACTFFSLFFLKRSKLGAEQKMQSRAQSLRRGFSGQPRGCFLNSLRSSNRVGQTAVAKPSPTLALEGP
jgi:hypothetical protein